MPSVLNLFQTFKFNKTIFIPQKFLFPEIFHSNNFKKYPSHNREGKEGRIEKETTARGFINYSSLYTQLHLKGHNQNHSILDF